MLANLVIGLREGLEASLIVAILIATAVQLDARSQVRRIWAGVAAAVVVSVVLAVGIVAAGDALPPEAEPLYSGVISLFAVGLLTWMVLWMATHSASLRSHLSGKVAAAVDQGSWALAVVAFFAVIREGLETVLFLFAGSESESGSNPWLGGILGLLIAAGLGVLLYRGVLRLDLRRVFWWSGLILLVIGASIVNYVVGEFAEIGLLPDTSWLGPVLAVAYLAVCIPTFRAVMNRRPSASRAAGADAAVRSL